MKSQITIRLPEDIEENLRELSEKFRLKRSDIVRMALEKFAREVKGGGEEKPYDKVANMIGTISSGLPDLGEAHRRHLLKKMRNHA
ncbi:MAG: ribbon-helix-helix domain-containing protein [Deltaproteobacteria bacterium]|nr:ribbon-helix-helix domain-containing protein [Deltaproteobacteria bacterium]